MSSHLDGAYDPYPPNGGNATSSNSPFSARSHDPSSATPFNQAHQSEDKTAGDGQFSRLRDEIQSTIHTMQANVNESAQRGVNIEALGDKSERLHDQSMMFKKSSNDVRKRMWMKNLKMKFLIGGGILLILIIIIVSSVVGSKHK